MTTRTLAALLGLAALTLTSGAALAQPAMATGSTDAPVKHTMHKAHHSVMVTKHGRTFGAGREASTDALNAQSLQAAQGGQPMTPMAPK